jgi:hypothetical protein
MGCRDVQALPPPFGPGAPQFAPHASTATESIRTAMLKLEKPVDVDSLVRRRLTLRRPLRTRL